jgi:hypothetical protein
MRKLFLLWALPLAFAAPPATTGSGEGSDRKAAIQATIYLDHDQITQILGLDPGPNIVLVDVKFTPGKGETIGVNRDDFLIRSDRTGEVVRPIEPVQLAGTSVMAVRPEGGLQNAPPSRVQLPGGIPWPSKRSPSGGSGGGTSTGPNRGNTGTTMRGPDAPKEGEEKPAGPTVVDTGSGKPNPLLDALQQKVLPEGETEKTVSGLLYFQMESRKIRIKDLELVYRKSPPRVSVRFIEPGKSK